MINDKNVVAIIPARGGSKGVPGKNIRKLSGLPLIAGTIETTKWSSFIDRVIVTTDDLEIARIAKEYGADVPFMRPSELATDTATSADTILHAINWLKSKKQQVDIIVLLQPTSPLRTVQDIDGAFFMYQQKNAPIVSVCEVEHHPFWTNILPADLSMKNFLRPEIKDLNRQQLPPQYRLNGAIYISDTDTYLREETFFTDNTFAYIMPQERSIDIDTEEDFFIAEILLANKGKPTN